MSSSSSSSSSFPSVTLNDGRTIPALAYGLGTANYGKPSSELVEMALKEAGYMHIDCAQVRNLSLFRYSQKRVPWADLDRSSFHVHLDLPIHNLARLDTQRHAHVRGDDTRCTPTLNP